MTTDDQLKQDAQRTLLAFFEAMHDWEASCEQLDEECDSGALEYEEAERVGCERLDQIFAQFCTRSPERRFSWGHPREYCPGDESIASVDAKSKSRIIISTDRVNGHNDNYVYELLRTDDGWRLDKRKTRRATGKLEEVIL